MNKAIDILLDLHHQIQIHKGSEQTTAGQKQLTEWNETDRALAIIERNIYGVDINQESVDISKLSLFLKIASPTRKLTNLSNYLKVGNSIVEDRSLDQKGFLWENEFPEVLKIDKFDIVIGNPPYGAEIPKDYKKYFKENYASATGRYDSYFYFIEKGISFLRDQGELGFIVPDTWLTNVQSQKLREFVLDNCSIKQIMSLPQNVFPDATVDTCLVILKKEESEKNRLKNKIEVIIYDKDAEVHNIQQEKFLSKINVIQKQWHEDPRKLFNVYMDDKKLIIINKIKQNTTPLEKITEMRRGGFCYRKSTLVKEFGEKKGNEILESRLWHSDHKVDQNYKKELLGSDIGRYSFDWKSNGWFKYGKHMASYVEPKFFENDYIAVQRIQNPKLKRRVIATIIQSGNDYYASSGLTSIILSDKTYSICYILAILNSKLMNWYYKQFFRDVNIKPEDLNQLPIKISENEQTQIVELTKKLLQNIEKQNELKRKFVSRLEDNLNVMSTNKIRTFHEIEFKELLTEIKSQKIKLNYTQQEELEDYFSNRKQEIKSLQEEQQETDNKIEARISELYGITDEEKKLFEI